MIETSNKKQDLKEFQKLLGGPDREYINYGKLLSPHCQIAEREDALGVLIEQEQKSEKHKTVVLSTDELVAECIKYNLTIIRSKEYRGDYGTDYLKNVKNFMESHGLAVSNYDLSTRCVVIFPRKRMFTISDKEICQHSNGARYNGLKVKNPTLLFKDGNYFHVVHQGTSYKNPYNLLRGLIFKTQTTNIIYRVLMFLITLIPLFTIADKNCAFWWIILGIAGAFYNAFHIFIDKKKHEWLFSDELFHENKLNLNTII